MIAHYGYEDGTGFFYLALDTDKCADCDPKGCIRACREEIFETEEDDWGDEVVVVSGLKVHQLKAHCDACKQVGNDEHDIPCLKACEKQAIQFTW